MNNDFPEVVPFQMTIIKPLDYDEEMELPYVWDGESRLVINRNFYTDSPKPTSQKSFGSLNSSDFYMEFEPLEEGFP